MNAIQPKNNLIDKTSKYGYQRGKQKRGKMQSKTLECFSCRGTKVDKSGKQCPVCDGSGWLWMPDIEPSPNRQTGERRKQERRKQERRNEKKFKHGALE